MVEEGTSVALIETDKAQVDFEVNEEMYLAKIVKTENDGMLLVGEIIGWAVED